MKAMPSRLPRWPGLVVLAVVAAAGAAAAQGSAGTFSARIEAGQDGTGRELGGLSIPALLQRTKVPGVSLAVIKDAEIHLAKAYGVADAAQNRPVRVDTTGLASPATIRGRRGPPRCRS